MSDSQDDPRLNPTAELAHEHEVVLLVVAAMEREAARIRAGGQIDSDTVEKMVRSRASSPTPATTTRRSRCCSPCSPRRYRWPRTR